MTRLEETVKGKKGLVLDYGMTVQSAHKLNLPVVGNVLANFLSHP